MAEARSIGSSDGLSTNGLGESVHTHGQRLFAFAICLLLVASALLAVGLGAAPGPQIKPFLPIVATTWALADLMTAVLLLGQFSVTGSRFLTALASAYALNGLLTWPYMLSFPGLFGSAPGAIANNPQVSACIWMLWHAAFALIVAVTVLNDPTFTRRIVSQTAIRNIVWVVVVASLCTAVALTALILRERASLPIMISHGHFTQAFRTAMRVVAALNFIGCCLLLRRRSSLTTMQLWLFVAMLTGMLEALLVSATVGPYSYGWYIGKLETVATSSIVLILLVREVTALYRRLSYVATIDTLTALPNRRALEDHMRLVTNMAKRHSLPLSLLVIDVDHFKGYNDAYGHAQGDECLRRVAALLRAAAMRPLDLTARYGGEEFVMLLPQTPGPGAVVVAERIQALIETGAIAYPCSKHGFVTVSVGVAHVSDARGIHFAVLFETADRALYEAKASGRNKFVVAEYLAPLSKIIASLPANPTIEVDVLR